MILSIMYLLFIGFSAVFKGGFGTFDPLPPLFGKKACGFGLLHNCRIRNIVPPFTEKINPVTPM